MAKAPRKKPEYTDFNLLFGNPDGSEQSSIKLGEREVAQREELDQVRQLPVMVSGAGQYRFHKIDSLRGLGPFIPEETRYNYAMLSGGDDNLPELVKWMLPAWEAKQDISIVSVQTPRARLGFLLAVVSSIDHIIRDNEYLSKETTPASTPSSQASSKATSFPVEVLAPVPNECGAIKDHISTHDSAVQSHDREVDADVSGTSEQLETTGEDTKSVTGDIGASTVSSISPESGLSSGDHQIQMTRKCKDDDAGKDDDDDDLVRRHFRHSLRGDGDEDNDNDDEEAGDSEKLQNATEEGDTVDTALTPVSSSTLVTGTEKRPRPREVPTGPLLHDPDYHVEQEVYPRAIILTMHRDRARVLWLDCMRLAYGGPVKTALLNSNSRVNRSEQMKLIRRRCHILVTLPGRLHDALVKSEIRLSEVCYLYVDSADTQSHQVFLAELESKWDLPSRARRQTLVVGTTNHHRVRQVQRTFMDPASTVELTNKSTLPPANEIVMRVALSKIDRDKGQVTTADLVPQLVEELNAARTNGYERTLIFCRSREIALDVAYFLVKELMREDRYGSVPFAVGCLRGRMDQDTIIKFRRLEVNVLISGNMPLPLQPRYMNFSISSLYSLLSYPRLHSNMTHLRRR